MDIIDGLGYKANASLEGGAQQGTQRSREPATWQEYLRLLIEDTQTRERIAEAAHVRPITLQRWAGGVSRPRDENIRLLLRVLPVEHYAAFLRLAAVDFPDLLLEDQAIEQVQQELPPEFYARVLSALALTPLPVARQTVQELIFRQVLGQLDPDRQGLSVSLVSCVPPPHGEKVRSLREVGGLGTPPWPSDLTQRTMFLGAESLVGHVISHMRSEKINSRDEFTFLLANWTTHERSVAAFPISRFARVAGGLLVSSSREYFFTESRMRLLERYAHLAALIFEQEEFYDVNALDLRIMPPEEVQRPYFHDFNRRVSRKFAEAIAERRQITLQEARQRTWQDLENELLQVFLHIGGVPENEP
jgi:transcriptional regulator with XRE-family HTH domain